MKKMKQKINYLLFYIILNTIFYNIKYFTIYFISCEHICLHDTLWKEPSIKCNHTLSNQIYNTNIENKLNNNNIRIKFDYSFTFENNSNNLCNLINKNVSIVSNDSTCFIYSCQIQDMIDPEIIKLKFYPLFNKIKQIIENNVYLEQLIETSLVINDVPNTSPCTFNCIGNGFDLNFSKNNAKKPFINEKEIDLIIFITLFPIIDGTKAWSIIRVIDQYNRPIVGQLNLDYYSFTNNLNNLNELKLIILHEIHHILGISSTLYNKYPMYKNIQDILYFNKEKEQIYIKTPKINTISKMYFNCTISDGVPMMTKIINKTNDSYYSTSHLMKKIFGNELMTGIIAPNSIYSFFSSIMLQDTNFYSAIYNNNTISYGKGSGCDFLSDQWNLKFNINEEEELDYCSMDRMWTIMDRNVDENIVFKNTILGTNDFCPQKILTSLCTEYVPSYNKKTYAEDYMENSRCFISSLYKGIGKEEKVTGRCYPIQCYFNNNSTILSIKLNDQWYNRSYNNNNNTIIQSIYQNITGYKGIFQFPKSLTNYFCTYNDTNHCIEKPCFNNGICLQGKCICSPYTYGGKCEYKLCPFIIDNNNKQKECNGNGICNTTNGICSCSLGYIGKRCISGIEASSTTVISIIGIPFSLDNLSLKPLTWTYFQYNITQECLFSIRLFQLNFNLNNNNLSTGGLVIGTGKNKKPDMNDILTINDKIYYLPLDEYNIKYYFSTNSSQIPFIFYLAIFNTNSNNIVLNGKITIEYPTINGTTNNNTNVSFISNISDICSNNGNFILPNSSEANNVLQCNCYTNFTGLNCSIPTNILEPASTSSCFYIKPSLFDKINSIYYSVLIENMTQMVRLVTNNNSNLLMAVAYERTPSLNDRNTMVDMINYLTNSSQQILLDKKGKYIIQINYLNFESNIKSNATFCISSMDLTFNSTLCTKEICNLHGQWKYETNLCECSNNLLWVGSCCRYVYGLSLINSNLIHIDLNDYYDSNNKINIINNTDNIGKTIITTSNTVINITSNIRSKNPIIYHIKTYWNNSKLITTLSDSTNNSNKVDCFMSNTLPTSIHEITNFIIVGNEINFILMNYYFVIIPENNKSIDLFTIIQRATVLSVDKNIILDTKAPTTSSDLWYYIVISASCATAFVIIIFGSLFLMRKFRQNKQEKDNNQNKNNHNGYLDILGNQDNIVGTDGTDRWRSAVCLDKNHPYYKNTYYYNERTGEGDWHLPSNVIPITNAFIHKSLPNPTK